MKNNINDEEDFMKDDGSMPSPPDEGDMCPEVEGLLPLILHPRPFGFMWTREKMRKFLMARGWKIKERYDEREDDFYSVAYKSGSKSPLPEEDNIFETFMDEMQDAIIDLLTTKKNDNGK